MAVQPDHLTTWDDYTARQAARETGEDLSGQLAGPIQPVRARKRRLAFEAKESSLAGLLMQAIQLAGARRGRLSQAESVREQTLLEVLTAAAIRRAQ
jgi:hypothetical protein